MDNKQSINIDSITSMYLQSLATCSLLAELSNKKFLKSKYFKKLKFQNDYFKMILIKSSIGNPACMMMMLYGLLVIPYETTDVSGLNFTEINNYINNISNEKPNSYKTTYKNENKESDGKNTNINYIDRIRNSVSHGRFEFEQEDKNCFVIFNDENMRDKNQHCSLKLKTEDVGRILEKLQKFLFEYFINYQQSQIKVK